MKILTDHRYAIGTGFGLAALLLLIGLSSGAAPNVMDISRYLHVLAGIVWIGLLYYFNFVQVPSLPGVSADTKADLFKEGSIVRRALFWFRWAAMATLILGLGLYMHLVGYGADGWDIRLGALLAIVMWFNVWFIIWPNQKKVIGIVSATPEEKAAAGKLALYASRTNTILSIPMLLLMVASAHFRLFG